jgi:hypothetical protein
MAVVEHPVEEVTAGENGGDHDPSQPQQLAVEVPAGTQLGEPTPLFRKVELPDAD